MKRLLKVIICVALMTGYIYPSEQDQPETAQKQSKFTKNWNIFKKGALKTAKWAGITTVCAVGTVAIAALIRSKADKAEKIIRSNAWHNRETTDTGTLFWNKHGDNASIGSFLLFGAVTVGAAAKTVWEAGKTLLSIRP